MKRVPLKYVQVKDKAWTRAMEENLHFISDMDPDRALAGFRRTAGIQTAPAGKSRVDRICSSIWEI